MCSRLCRCLTTLWKVTYENEYGGEPLLWKLAWKYTFSWPNIGRRHSPFWSVGGGLWRQASRRTTADCLHLSCSQRNSASYIWQEGWRLVRKARCHVTNTLWRFAATKDAKKNGLITGKIHFVDAILNASFNLCAPEYDIVIICSVQLCNAPLWHRKGHHPFSSTLGRFVILPFQLCGGSN